LPSLDDLEPDEALLVHQTCNRFEAAWKDWQGGVRPALEDWLVDVPAAVRGVLLRELLRMELEYRRTAGGRRGLADSLCRLGADEGLLRRVLSVPSGNETVPEPGHEQTPDSSAPQPERIGRYRIERVLGKGGFGLVYLAHDDQLQRSVAIKVPHRKLVDRPEAAEAYLTEARTVANLDHPNIVPVHDVGSTEEFPCYVVSKYIDGTDLATRLKQSRILMHGAVVELVATVAEALHHAHKQGLV